MFGLTIKINRHDSHECFIRSFVFCIAKRLVRKPIDTDFIVSPISKQARRVPYDYCIWKQIFPRKSIMKLG